jgi:hypothetical protein
VSSDSTRGREEGRNALPCRACGIRSRIGGVGAPRAASRILLNRGARGDRMWCSCRAATAAEGRCGGGGGGGGEGEGGRRRHGADQHHQPHHTACATFLLPALACAICCRLCVLCCVLSARCGGCSLGAPLPCLRHPLSDRRCGCAACRQPRPSEPRGARVWRSC